MSLKPLEKNVAIHQTLGNNPNTDNNLSADELKVLFDEGAVTLKDYLNEQVVPEVNSIEGNIDGLPTTGYVDAKAEEAYKKALLADKTNQNWATVKLNEPIPEIVNIDSLRNYFYKLRKSPDRQYQVESSWPAFRPIVDALGLPEGATEEDNAFVCVHIPQSEAGAFQIEFTYILRNRVGVWHRMDYATHNTETPTWHVVPWSSSIDLAGGIADNRNKIAENEMRIDELAAHQIGIVTLNDDFEKVQLMYAKYDALVLDLDNRGTASLHFVTNDAFLFTAQGNKVTIDSIGYFLTRGSGWTTQEIPISVPQATEAALGGIKAAPAAAEDTQPVHIKSDGTLVTKPSGGGGNDGKSIAWGELVDPASASDSHAFVDALIKNHTRFFLNIKNASDFKIGDTAMLPGQYNDAPRQHYVMLFDVAKITGQKIEGYALAVIEEGKPGKDAEPIEPVKFNLTDLGFGAARFTNGEWQSVSITPEIQAVLNSITAAMSSGQLAVMTVETDRYLLSGYAATTDGTYITGHRGDKIISMVVDTRGKVSIQMRGIVLTVVITPNGPDEYVADHTAYQIIDADRTGVVKAEFTDPESRELRTYYYAKQTSDGRAVFSKDGYIVDGVAKQSLIYVSDTKRVSVETRSATEEVIDVDAEMKQYMQVVKPELVAAINEKGGAATMTDAMGELPDRVRGIPNGVSPTENLPDQTVLTAAEATGTVTLKWQDTGAAGYTIVRKMSAEPKTPSDGTEVYRGAALTCADTVTEKDVVVYYRVYPYNTKGQYQAYPGDSIAAVKIVDRSGQKQLGDLQLEDEIILGTWEGQPLRWTVKDTTAAKYEGIVSIGAKNALFNGPFDAPEDTPENPNPITSRKQYGNNRWAVSNARQWLNSAGAKNEWYAPQHKYDAPPPYKNRDGFLRSFNEYELRQILIRKNKSFLADADGGGYETSDDKVWLASSFDVGLSTDLVDSDHIFDGMASAAQRRFESNYWTRTINAKDNPSSVRYVRSSGGWYNVSGANDGNAFRPFCQLPSGTYVRWSDELSAYILADDSLRQVTV